MATARRTTGSDNNGSASGLAGRVTEEMSDFSERARGAVGDAARRAGEFATDVGDGVVRGGRKAAKFVVREVKEHPIRTLAIGAAVGVAVAAFFMLRNRERDDD